MRGIRHTGIYVNDLPKMVAFYMDVFDLKIAVHQKESGTYTDTIFQEHSVEIEVFKLSFEDQTMIELIQYAHQNTLPNWQEKIYECGKMHIAITIDSAEEMYYKLKNRHCKLLSKPCMSSDGKAKVFFARDLEGNYLELVEEQ